MNTTKSLQRTMIILWKWQELLNRPLGYDEFVVAKSEDDKIIRINIFDIETVINLIVELVSKEKGKVFIFLHRNHGLNETHVQLILERLQSFMNTRTIKCFLFSNGRDFIYYYVKGEGLLDGIGYFAEGDYEFIDKNGDEYEEEVSVLEYEGEDDRKRLLGVKYQHFHRTWKYYDNEFYDKIKSLGVDLMCALTFNAPKEQTGKEWYQYLSQLNTKNDKLVWYRLKSLLGLYIFSDDIDVVDKQFLEKELNMLSAYEKTTEISFSFDDVRVNLGEHHQDGVDKNYFTLCKIFDNIIKKNDAIISITMLRDSFDNLLKAIE